MASRRTIAASILILMTSQIGAEVFAADLGLKTYEWGTRLVISPNPVSKFSLGGLVGA